MVIKPSNQEINWVAETEAFDGEAANISIRKMWLKLAHQISEVVEGSSDWMDDSASADEVIRLAARAEACMWAATGDTDSIDFRDLAQKFSKEPTQ